MQTFVTVIHVLACLFIIPVILIQSGKGADISASFGGSSQTVFGSSGGANVFTRVTTILAAIFMVTSLLLTTLANQSRKSVFEGQNAPATTAVPATDSSAAPTAAASGAPAAAASTAPAAPAVPAEASKN